MSDTLFESENSSKRLKLNPIIEFVIQSVSSTQKATVEFMEDQITLIIESSEYIKTLIENCFDTEKNVNCIKLIYLIEEKPNEAAAFLTLLSNPYKTEIIWDQYHANLSSKWIVSKYIEKYNTLICDYFDLYKISDKDLIAMKDNNLFVQETFRLTYVDKKYIRSNSTDYFFINIDKYWCYKAIDEEIYIQDQENEETELYLLSGMWKSLTSHSYSIFIFNQFQSKLQNSNDLIKFCEIIELILMHECYYNKYISSMNDLYEYLSRHLDFVTKDTLNRLLKTKEELIEYSIIVSRNHSLM